MVVNEDAAVTAQREQQELQRQEAERELRRWVEELQPAAQWHWVWTWPAGLAAVVIGIGLLVVVGAWRQLPAGALLAVVGLTWDVAGVILLTSAVWLSNDAIYLRSTTRVGINPDVARSMLKDRYTARAGLVLATVVFLLQAVGAIISVL